MLVLGCAACGVILDIEPEPPPAPLPEGGTTRDAANDGGPPR